MRKVFIAIILTTVVIILSTSCEEMFGDYLDKAPGVDVTEDTIFSSKTQMETYLAGMYNEGIVHGLPYWDEQARSDALSEGATDAGEFVTPWYWTNAWNDGSYTTGWNRDWRWNTRWRAIRRCNIMIERIDDVPDVSDAYSEQIKAEAKFIRALNYWDMLRYLGGVPIIDRRIGVSENALLPRNTIQEVVDFIVKDCDEAASVLPDEYPEIWRGRATKGSALALKSRTLLYAASPLLNSETPYLDLGADNDLICYGNYDLERWKIAADAAKAVLDWAPTAGCRLITEHGFDKNYQYVWETHDNDEIILEHKGKGTYTATSIPWSQAVGPYIINDNTEGCTIPMNFVQLYEKKDGTPQTWDMKNGGDDLNTKYEELDPRFVQTIAYNGSYWNDDAPEIQTFEGGKHAQGCYGGAWLRKTIPSYLTRTQPAIPLWIVFRLAEFYLNYAEALNEYYGSPPQEAYDAVNIIRARSGMPDIPNGLSKEEFRERVRRERAIELAYEDHRWWDIKRWKLGKEILAGEMWGIKIYKIADTDPQEFRYEPYVFEERVFNTRDYFYPFVIYEVDKGYLVQNPGW